MSRRKKPFPFFLWHRRLGLVALVLVFILSITGILLNHTESLQLDEKTLESSWILDWYGINPEGKPRSFKFNSAWASQWEQQIFVNAKSILAHKENIQGIVQYDDFYAIALQHYVLLVDTDGEIIELMHTGIKSNLKSIGLVQMGTGHELIALKDENNQFYLSNEDLTKWVPAIETRTKWPSLYQPEDNELKLLQTAFRGKGLSLERVILDLHSGRFFNPVWGIYIMDASAILMMLLGISGLWVWWSRRLKMRRKKHYQKHH